MSFGAALADARATSRIAAAQVRYWQQHRRTAPLLFAAIHAVPLLVPLFLWLGQATELRVFGVAALAVILVFSGHQFQSLALNFAANDVLRQPSKAGIVLFRLWCQLPHMLFIGMCWAAGYLVLQIGLIAANPTGTALLSLAIILSPVAWTIAKLSARLIGDDVSSLGPLLVPTAAAIYGGCILRDATASPGQLVACALVLGIGTLALGRIVFEWLRAPRLHLRVLVAEAAMLPRLLVACGCVLPASSAILRLGPAALLMVLFLIATSLRRLLATVQQAEETTPGSPIRNAGTRDDEDPVHVKLPTAHPGQRSLMRAHWFAHRRQYWFRPGELDSLLAIGRRLGRIVPMLLYHGWGVLLAILAMLGNAEVMGHTILAVVAGLTAPSLVSSRLSAVLHRLGVDYTEQALHNLRAWLWFAVVPTLTAAAVMAIGLGFDHNRLRLLVVLAGALAVRVGLRGLGNLQETEPWRHWHRLGLGIPLLLCLLVSAPSVWPAVGVLLFALIGVALRLRRLDERTLCEGMLEAERPTS